MYNNYFCRGMSNAGNICIGFTLAAAHRRHNQNQSQKLFVYIPSQVTIAMKIVYSVQHERDCFVDSLRFEPHLYGWRMRSRQARLF
jgi:hypothetical protein